MNFLLTLPHPLKCPLFWGLSSRGFPQLCSFSTLLVTLDTSLASCSDMFVQFWVSSHRTPLFPYPCATPQPSHTVVIFGDISFLPGFFFPSRVAFAHINKQIEMIYAFQQKHTVITVLRLSFFHLIFWEMVSVNTKEASLFFFNSSWYSTIQIHCN